MNSHGLCWLAAVLVFGRSRSSCWVRMATGFGQWHRGVAAEVEGECAVDDGHVLDAELTDPGQWAWGREVTSPRF